MCRRPGSGDCSSAGSCRFRVADRFPGWCRSWAGRQPRDACRCAEPARSRRRYPRPDVAATGPGLDIVVTFWTRRPPGRRCPFRAVHLWGPAARGRRVGLPAREQPIDVRVQQEHERVAERDMRPAHADEAVHVVVDRLEPAAHDHVVARFEDRRSSSSWPARGTRRSTGSPTAAGPPDYC